MFNRLAACAVLVLGLAACAQEPRGTGDLGIVIARASGETAPLLFTSLSSPFFSLDLGKEVANLPVVINNFAGSPYENWRQLAWTGALLITITVLSLSIAARALTARGTQR